ncbi:MAG TPA: alkene reductase [Rubricoccaceae bacterium]|jgi:N-ethylmaleimide reductase
MSRLDLLLAPTTWSGLDLANRVVMAPMTRSRALGNVPNAMMAEYYAQRASAGLIVTEGTSPSPNGLGYARIPGLFTDEHVAGWKLVTDAVHARGGKIVVQLMHTGRIAHGLNLPDGAEIVAPSSVAAAGEMWTDEQQMQPHPAPREMTTAEVQAAVAEHGTAARLAKLAGFDGVEVHGANGYLVEQFLNPGSNQRTDQYGGSVENRARFLVEVVAAVAAEIGADRTGLRLSPHSQNGDLAAVENVGEVYGHVAREVAALGIGYLHLVDHSAMGGASVPDATVDAIRGAFTGTFIRTGGFTAETAEAALASGGADLIGFGRPFISNPDLVERFAADAPLADPDPATFYAPGPNGFEQGYTDYPALAEAAV